jgi:hypothetical protein
MELGTKVEFRFEDEVIQIANSFCHFHYMRVSMSKLPFTNFTYSYCLQISKKHDF